VTVDRIAQELVLRSQNSKISVTSDILLRSQSWVFSLTYR